VFNDIPPEKLFYIITESVSQYNISAPIYSITHRNRPETPLGINPIDKIFLFESPDRLQRIHRSKNTGGNQKAYLYSTGVDSRSSQTAAVRSEKANGRIAIMGI
jgi:hypothetical protein